MEAEARGFAATPVAGRGGARGGGGDSGASSSAWSGPGPGAPPAAPAPPPGRPAAAQQRAPSHPQGSAAGGISPSPSHSLRDHGQVGAERNQSQHGITIFSTTNKRKKVSSLSRRGPLHRACTLFQVTHCNASRAAQDASPPPPPRTKPKPRRHGPAPRRTRSTPSAAVGALALHHASPDADLPDVVENNTTQPLSPYCYRTHGIQQSASAMGMLSAATG